jgi:hypothetical protein
VQVLTVVVGFAVCRTAIRNARKLSEKKTAFALDPGIFVLWHILIFAHDLLGEKFCLANFGRSQRPVIW